MFASIIVVALLMAPVHDSSQFVGTHAAAEHVARCTLIQPRALEQLQIAHRSSEAL